MKYIHISKLEEYNPGYKDRQLYWCKAHFKMLSADPEFEMFCEIDKWRFLAFIMLEMQIKRPVPLEIEYLTRKGFDFKKRSLLATLESLSKSIEIVSDLMKPIDINNVTEEKNTDTQLLENCAQSRVDKSREEKSRVECTFDFEPLWNNYPSKVGKKAAAAHFNSTVRSEKDYQDIKTALENYRHSERVEKGFIQDGKTWFNNWRDWVDIKTVETEDQRVKRLAREFNHAIGA